MPGPRDSERNKVTPDDSESDVQRDKFDGIIRVDEWGNSWDESGEFADMDFRLVDE